MDMCGMVLWAHLSHRHSLCEGHSQSAQDAWAKARLVPKEGGATTSLGHVVPSHCSGAVFSTCLVRGPCVAACWLLSFHWAPLRRFGSAFTVYLSHSGRCTWGTICCFSSELKKPISLGVSLHTTCSSLVAATGLKPVTIYLTLATQTGHSVPCTALAVPGSREHSPDNYLRDSHCRLTWRKQLNLECCAYYNHDV